MRKVFKPRYVDPGGDSGSELPMAPPFTFRGVTSRVFPPARKRGPPAPYDPFASQYDEPPSDGRLPSQNTLS